MVLATMWMRPLPAALESVVQHAEQASDFGTPPPPKYPPFSRTTIDSQIYFVCDLQVSTEGSHSVLGELDIGPDCRDQVSQAGLHVELCLRCKYAVQFVFAWLLFLFVGEFLGLLLAYPAEEEVKHQAEDELQF